MKKYDSYTDSGVEWIGLIPSHWSHSNLKWYSDIYSGGTPSKDVEEYWSNGTIPWLNSGSVNQGDIVEASEYITEEAYNNSSAKWISEGSLILALAGQGKTKGMVAQVKFKTTCNQSLGVIVPNDKINNRFLLYWIRSNYQNIRNLGGGDKRDGLNLVMLGAIPMPIPTISEQAKISEFLDTKADQIEQLIAKKETFIQLLEEERVSIINQAVTKGLDPSVPMKDTGIEWLGEIPQHWEVKKLKQIFNSSKGLTITKENLESEGFPCINYGEIHSKFGFELDIDKHKLKCVNSSYLDSDIKSLIKTGDFVFADTSEDVIGAGNFTYLKSNNEIFAGYHTIILRAFQNIEPRFFAYLFDSITFRTQIRQSVKGIKVFSITQGILKNTSVWIPSLYKQKQIIEFLDIEIDRIFRLKNSAQQEIELLKEYKTALISEVVTGKVDVRDEKLN